MRLVDCWGHSYPGRGGGEGKEGAWEEDRSSSSVPHLPVLAEERVVKCPNSVHFRETW